MMFGRNAIIITFSTGKFSLIYMERQRHYFYSLIIKVFLIEDGFLSRTFLKVGAETFSKRLIFLNFGFRIS